MSFFLVKGIVQAADPPVPGNVLPAGSDFTQGSRVNLLTAIYGNGYLLDSPVSVVRLYTAQTHVSLNILNGGNCPGIGGDVGPDNSQATTTFRVYELSPVSNPYYTNTPFGARFAKVAQVNNTTIGCASSYTLHFNSDRSAVGVGPASGKYAFEIEATMTGSPGWNMFKYSVPQGTGRLSYYAGSGDHFALKAASSAGIPGDPGEFKLGFAPGCGLLNGDTPSSSVYLKFFDPDAGQANQAYQTPVKTTLIEYDNSGTQLNSWNYNTTIGNNAGGQFDVTAHIKGHHKYEWVWHSIYSANGIQFQLPYDSYNTLIDYNTDCPSQAPTISCNASNIPNPEPDFSDPKMYNVVVEAYGNNNLPYGPNYTVKLTANANTGATVTGPPSISFAIPDPPGHSQANPWQSTPFYFGGYFDYTGSYTAKVFDSNGNQVAHCGNSDTPATRPFFQVWNGDTSTGGGYGAPVNTPDISVIGACSISGNSPYISPAVGSAGGSSAGGIRAYSNPGVPNNVPRGSGADFGVIAMGLINQANFSYMGYQSFDDSSDPGPGAHWFRRPVFSNDNTIPNSYGGYYNASRPVGCIKDFFTDTRANPTAEPAGTYPSGLGNLINSCSTDPCQYKFATGTVTINGITNVLAGQRATFYVDGDVQINQNIQYAGNFNATNPKNIPYLTIIARGNIIVGPNVTQLDGLYVAQPLTAGGKGVFLTCPQGASWAYGGCSQQLVVNGAVIAQKVDLLRAHGTLHGGNVVKYQPAELFNFTPSMVIGEPAFAQQPSGPTYSAAPIF